MGGRREGRVVGACRSMRVLPGWAWGGVGGWVGGWVEVLLLVCED